MSAWVPCVSHRAIHAGTRAPICLRRSSPSACWPSSVSFNLTCSTPISRCRRTSRVGCLGCSASAMKSFRCCWLHPSARSRTRSDDARFMRSDFFGSQPDFSFIHWHARSRSSLLARFFSRWAWRPSGACWPRCSPISPRRNRAGCSSASPAFVRGSARRSQCWCSARCRSVSRPMAWTPSQRVVSRWGLRRRFAS